MDNNAVGTSKIITYPDFVEESIPSMLLVTPIDIVLEMTIDACRTIDGAVNIFLASDDEPADWLNKVSGSVDRVFTHRSDFSEIYDFIKQ